MTPTILIAVAITGIVALTVGILIGVALGMSLQWRRNKPHMITDGGTGELEARVKELEEWQIGLWHTIETQAEYIDALEAGDDDGEWDFDQDDPEYVAGEGG